jgi:hypothetical protein
MQKRPLFGELPASRTTGRSTSAFVRANDKRVARHVRQDVKATGLGWNPLYLTTAWRYSLSRLEVQGILTFDANLGGYVPTNLVGEMRAENAALSGRIIAGERPYLADLSESERRAVARCVIARLLTVDADGRVKPATPPLVAVAADRGRKR